MARIRLIHWNGPEGRECKRRLVDLGHQVDFDDLEVLQNRRALRTNLPDAYVIDLSYRPSHGREIAMSLRTRKDTRPIPIVFVDGEPQKVAQIKAFLPDATYTTWGRVKTALPKAMARPLTTPVVPPSSIFSGKPTIQKLGVKAEMRVCLLGAPKGFAQTLTPLPAGVTFSARPDADCGLFLAFVRSRRDVAAQFVAAGRVITRQSLWIIWPKKASGIKSDVDANAVRAIGLAGGWVDYKVCSVDEIWSGYAFSRRR
jgi:CheY-like chemotaxis protein